MPQEISSLNAGINLIPQTTKKPQQVRKALLLAVLVTRYVLIATGVVGLGLLGLQVYLSNSLQNALEEVTEHVAYIESKSDFQKDFTELQTYAAVLGATYSNLEPKASFFEILEAITPKAVVLTDLSIDANDIRISGETSEYPVITDYFDQLVSSDSFENVQIINITRPTEEGSNTILFTIAAKMQ